MNQFHQQRVTTTLSKALILLLLFLIGCQENVIADHNSTPNNSVTNNSTANCLAGYVISGGDSSAPDLADAPRWFKYQIQTANDQHKTVTYRALPPSPSGSSKSFALTFHGGKIQIDDYLEACGKYNPDDQTLLVSQANHYIKTIPATKIILVRHAERADNSPNANLAIPQGINRARKLADIATNADVVAIYSTPYCRTAQTAQPTAIALNLPIQFLASSDPNASLDNCNPAIKVLEATLPPSIASIAQFTQEIKAKHQTQAILIIAHSNSVPELITELGGTSPCPQYFPFNDHQECHIPKDQFDNLFTILLNQASDQVIVKHEMY